MKKLILSMMAVFGLSILMAVPSLACTSYYVGSDLTKDGSAIYGRTEDIGSAYDKVFKVVEPKEVGENAMWKDSMWTSDGSSFTQFTGPIKVSKTYRYTICRDSEAQGDGLFGEIGVNEKGVSMSATTTAYCGEHVEKAEPFAGSTGISEENYVDYVLCQASSAKDGVEILAKAIDDYGVWYTADGVFIADNTEVWYFEILSNHQYCAIKMPKDKAAIIPNTLVIGDVDLDSPDVYASKDIVKLAKDNNFYHEALENKDVNDINVRLTYVGKGYKSGNADRIRAGQYILTGKDNTDIYTADYQDIFFDIPSKDVTVEKMYELAGSQYEEFENFTAARREAGITSSVRYIGVASSAECHIMQIRSDMPAQLATIQWQSLSSAAYTTFVPFYSALLTNVPDSYKEEAHKYSDTSAYWTYQSLGARCRQDPQVTGAAVKKMFKEYMNKLEKEQKNVDAQMMDIYKNNPAKLEETATALGISIGDQTVNLAKKIKEDVSSVEIKATIDDITYSVDKLGEKPSTEQPTPDKTVKAPGKVSIKKVKNLKKKKLQVKLTKVSDAEGYEIAYSTNVNFRKAKTKVTTISAKNRIKVLKGLKKGKTYYVKARAYKLDGAKKVCGSWSKIKVVKISK